jgi:hypothetical protein
MVLIAAPAEKSWAITIDCITKNINKRIIPLGINHDCINDRKIFFEIYNTKL